jgi:Secretion system C-terminal sorting domain
MALAIVKADKAVNDRFTFVHEIGHLFGGLHRTMPGTTPPAGFFAFGNCFRAGPNFWSIRNWETVMSVTCGVRIIDKFSSPNATLYGTPTGTANKDVARKITERASTVGDFVTDLGAILVSASGESYLQPFQNYTYTATPFCESGTVNFNWEVSSDGFTFYNVLSGVGQSNYSFYYNPYTFTNTVIRVTITDGLGRTAVDFIYLQLSGPQMLMNGGQNNKPPDLYSPKIEATAYPNPTNGDNLVIDFKLGEDSKEVSIELLNNEGKVLINILKKDLVEGNYIENLNIKNLTNGFYILKTSIDGNPVFKKVVISK